MPDAAILVARRMGPAELLGWHARGIAAIAIEEASPSGHAAILARALGIPAIGGLRGILDAAESGDAGGGGRRRRPPDPAARA